MGHSNTGRPLPVEGENQSQQSAIELKIYVAYQLACIIKVSTVSKFEGDTKLGPRSSLHKKAFYCVAISIKYTTKKIQQNGLV